MDTTEENRKMIEKWPEKHRILKTSFLNNAREASKKHHLPTNREQKEFVDIEPPCRQAITPTIRTELSDPSADKNTVTPFLKTIALETIHTYPPEIIHVYTDGSAQNATF